MAYLPLSTANLPDPVIDPAQGASPADYFGTVLYTAASSNGTYTHGDLNFRPDFTWIKNRNNVERHFLVDVVRGNTSVTDKFLVSNDTSAEGANGVAGTTFSVTDTGYEFVETSIDNGELYFNSRTYVGWNWKANGSGVSNTDGSITSTVSANTTSGFSIITYTGNGASGQSIGHGLNSKPELVFKKNRSTAANWAVTTTIIDGSNDYAFLNATNAFGNSAEGAPTSSVIPVYPNTENNSSGDNFICYAFHSVEGFSKIGKYVGNGSTDGPFVYTGFRPAWVMIKRATNNTGWWTIFDTAREPTNDGSAGVLAAQSSGAESTQLSSSNFDMLSNGFKIGSNNDASDVNATGNTYIYMAFAENPFKYSNAR